MDDDLEEVLVNETDNKFKQSSQVRFDLSTTDTFDAWIKSQKVHKPEDQLELTEAELSEEITKKLTQTNTNVIKNLVVYSFKEGAFVPYEPESDTVTLYSLQGTALHIDSEEAQKQLAEEFKEEKEEEAAKAKAKQTATATAAAGNDEEEEVEAELENDNEQETPEDDEEGHEEDYEQAAETENVAEPAEQEGEEVQQQKPTGKKRKLVNQFNFCERATLTFNNPLRSVETQTVPPPRSKFGANVLQWVIYDSYAEDYAQQLKEREKEKKPNSHKKDFSKLKYDKQEEKEALNRKYLQAWKILERMINQNAFDEIAQDYRYYEDPSDEFREGEGTLLPLWRFSYEKTKRMNITDLCFNPLYYDLFAVTYGSFDFMRQNSEGAVCLFTIKNPSYPDFKMILNSGVMCCDIHPKYPYLLAIGLYDGNVIVYNLKGNSNNPLYVSQGVNGKHSECVWEIKWGPDMADGEINFYSISSDGRVFNWVLMQNKLSITTIITLYLDRDPIIGPDATKIRLKSCGTCMTFHPQQQEIFLIGTEEGLIYKCNTSYSSKYLITYEAHFLSVYRIDYNKFNSNIFISCSADWTIKIWEDMRLDPLFVFNLGSAVGDVKWAPYSSTVFAAVTSEGKVFVYDLNVNKYKPICVQAIVNRRRNKLTRLTFNQKLPFIIVGDDKGTVISLKLSPNLRLQVKPPKKQQTLDQHSLQIQKLEKLLSLVRELPEGEEIQENVTTTST